MRQATEGLSIPIRCSSEGELVIVKRPKQRRLRGAAGKWSGPMTVAFKGGVRLINWR